MKQRKIKKGKYTMAATIIRSKRNRNFSIIDIDLINNSSLSFKARGLLIYMLSKPDDWKFSTTRLARRSSKDGITAIRTALEEIEKAGYLIRQKNRKENGQFGGITWKLADTPTFLPQADDQEPKASKDVRQLPDNIIQLRNFKKIKGEK